MTQCKPINTPMPSGHKLSTQNGEPLPEAHEYRQIVGALQYLTMTRPDLTYAVNQVCQYMHKPTTDHLAAVKRILRYVKGTVGAGTTIKPSSLNLLGAYTDADWAGCPDTRRSTSGFCTFLGSNLLSWGSKKQPTVSRSSTEAEYKALAFTVSELLWLSYVFRDLHLDITLPLIVCCDNISATQMSANPILHARTKHIELDYHFVRDLVINKQVQVRFVRSTEQMADIFTKGLPTPLFQQHTTKLLWLPPKGLWGDERPSQTQVNVGSPNLQQSLTVGDKNPSPTISQLEIR
ncbi:uncharacterized mitochondrial protein AtMg00810-like [Telopea speciosissima]|uniref:uncharacterized mitochondrial protein AtMg00810-like n=1 Tax=Telopea speciosissima TaxID=54955 RepID=UPI001CC59099|nr:uncharacterized mitochondrial protein AtMg00810-like [Telopea speciosissima]